MRSDYNVLRTNTKHQHDDYWRLQANNGMTAPQMRDILQSRHFPVTKSATKDGVEHSLLRSDCGMISYAGQSNDRLRDFIKARRIAVTGCNQDCELYCRHAILASIIKGHKVGHRNDLLYLLEKHDASPQFHRFSDLPAELRNKIYEYYFAEIKQSLYAPTEPPIARVSRLLRKETIKMFYHVCTFDLVLRLPGVADLPWNHRELQGDPGALKIPNQMRFFITSIASDHLTCIRRIRIQIVDHKTRDKDFQDHESTALTIELPEQGEEYTLKSEKLASILKHHSMPVGGNRTIQMLPLPNAFARARRNLVMRSIEKVVKDIVARDGKAKLKMEDFFALRRAVEGGLPPRV